MKTEIDKTTLRKFEKWKRASVWDRINIRFTLTQRDKLVRAGLVRAGLFGGIEEIDAD